jgi:hypothetical protein
MGKIKVVTHEDYGGFCIKRYSARQVEEMSAREAKQNGFQLVYWIIANALVDAGGNRIYSDDRVDALGDEDMVFLTWIQSEILAHNNMGVGQAVKNSEAIQSESSPIV